MLCLCCKKNIQLLILHCLVVMLEMNKMMIVTLWKTSGGNTTTNGTVAAAGYSGFKKG